LIAPRSPTPAGGSPARPAQCRAGQGDRLGTLGRQPQQACFTCTRYSRRPSPEPQLWHHGENAGMSCPAVTVQHMKDDLASLAIEVSDYAAGKGFVIWRPRSASVRSTSRQPEMLALEWWLRSSMICPSAAYPISQPIAGSGRPGCRRIPAFIRQTARIRLPGKLRTLPSPVARPCVRIPPLRGAGRPRATGPPRAAVRRASRTPGGGRTEGSSRGHHTSPIRR
jgi:hypothetical protein